MVKRIGVVSCIALCQDCGEEFLSYKNGQALAAKHAIKYKHSVAGEVGIAFRYNGRETNNANHRAG